MMIQRQQPLQSPPDSAQGFPSLSAPPCTICTPHLHASLHSCTCVSGWGKRSCRASWKWTGQPASQPAVTTTAGCAMIMTRGGFRWAWCHLILSYPVGPHLSLVRSLSYTTSEYVEVVSFLHTTTTATTRGSSPSPSR